MPAPRWPVLGTFFLLAVSAWLAAAESGPRHAALLLVGAGLGFALFKSGFGFAGAWRAMVSERRGAGLRAQLALLAILTVAFFPLLGHGEAFGRPLADVVRPVGVSLLAGAFLFGIGAQLASACSSGSFAALGNGKLRYLIVAMAMVIGATVGSAHIGWWESQPSWISFSMLREWGPVAGMAANLSLIALLAVVSICLEKARYGHLQRRTAADGSWSMSWGVLALGLLCLVTLLLAGRPWIIVSALPLWGAKIINATGLPWDVAFWEYWSSDARAGALDASLWSDITTLMIAGLVIGTALAAALGRRLHFVWKIRAGEALSALTGGFLLGYGGVVGLGCNIGALLAGVASGSLHGWVWLLAAFAGTAGGIFIKSLRADRLPAIKRIAASS